MTDLADAVVVGGGIAGASIAYALAERSMRVVLLEKRLLASGGTAGSFAWVNAASFDEDSDYHRLNASAVRFVGSLSAQRAVRGAIYAGGALAWTEQGDISSSERLAARAGRLQALNYPVTVLTPAEMRALEPAVDFPSDSWGLFTPAECWVNVQELVRRLSHEVRNRKGEVLENVAATGFTCAAGAISTVETPKGRIAAPVVVLAAGADTPSVVAGVINEPERPGIGWGGVKPVVVLETAAGFASGLDRRVLVPPDPAGLRIRPTAEGGLVAAADDVNSGPGATKVDSQVLKDRSGIVERVVRHLPGLSKDALAAASTARAHLAPATPDGRPVVGALPGATGAYVLVAENGATLAPYLADLLAQEIVTGRMPVELNGLRPDRFWSRPSYQSREARNS